MFVNLISALRAKGVRGYEAARKAGMTETKLSRALHGRAEYSLAERQRIAELLGLNEAWLYDSNCGLGGWLFARRWAWVPS